ncbi:MAG TPA: DUF1990 family protein [Frankiaceae bacterium]|nr:DUF1990 family protein [Frankiaceae bacterium]
MTSGATSVRTTGSDPVVEVGCTVVNAAPVGPVALLAPCRVVSVFDEPRRRGFAYGTLPGHPLTVRNSSWSPPRAEGACSCSIRSFSRPVGVARVSPRLARAGQHFVNRRHAAAARRLCA